MVLFALKDRTLTTLAAIMVVLALPAAFASGQILGGHLEGEVTLMDGQPVPGVLVTASSPVMRGTRTTLSDEKGGFVFLSLRPGIYTFTFELANMATLQRSLRIDFRQLKQLPIVMQVQALEDTIVVIGELGNAFDDYAANGSISTSSSFSFEEVNALPIGRDPGDVASLAPGLVQNTPNGGQVTIFGGQTNENVWLFDGVDISNDFSDNSLVYNRQASPVYVEDAIADMQVLTSGVSAEYGRFSGGVVNFITKSGGNEFSGTLRADLESEAWRSRTSREREKGIELLRDVFERFSTTLGGYAIKDEIWFFAAGRYQDSSGRRTFFRTPLSGDFSLSDERAEVKATVNIVDKHQIQGVVNDSEQTTMGSNISVSVTPATLATAFEPSSLGVLRYSGVLTPSVFTEAQYSEKRASFRREHPVGVASNPGSREFIEDSPFLDFFTPFGGHYNAPYFDGSDPEDRDNQQLAASLSYFLDTASTGSHDLKLGFEDFDRLRTGGNSQSPTGFVMSASVRLNQGNVNDPVVINGDLIPVWTPGASGAWRWLANRNARLETQIRSLYANDRWQLTDNWSFNIGFRYEDARGGPQAGITTIDSAVLVPRLAASYDVRGDGMYRFDLTYGQYAGPYSEAQLASNIDVANPLGLLYLYIGPPGVGYDFAPAYDFGNQLGTSYTIRRASSGNQNIFVDPDIRPPIVDEVTLAAGRELRRGGFLKAIYTCRDYRDLVEDFTTTTTGVSEVLVDGISAGIFSNTFITNSHLAEREYEAFQVIGRYRVNDRWTLDGHYTWQLRNHGNFEGERANSASTSSLIGDYPEIRNTFSHYPTGRLSGFQEHRLRTWTNYNLDFEEAGDLNFGFLLNWDSGRVLSRTSTLALTPEQQATLDALYVDGPASQTIWYGSRGDVEFDSALTFDVSVNYQLPLFGDLDLWIKLDVTNLFDEDSQISGETNVSPCYPADHSFYRGGCIGPVDPLGLPLTFEEPAYFADDRSNGDFVAPREVKLTLGFRW